MKDGVVELYVGVDAGGTSVDVKCQFDGGVVKSSQHPGTNLNRDGEQETCRRLTEAVLSVWSERLSKASLNVVIGLAGASDPRRSSAIAERIRTTLESEKQGSVRIARLEIVPDSRVALESAFPDESGALIVLGTGSAVVARTRDGEWFSRGGWGYKLGDEGGGYAIGIAGLRLIAAALDGRPSRLATHLQRQLRISTRAELIRAVYEDGYPIQTIAPLILDAADRGDADAGELLMRQVHAVLLGLEDVSRDARLRIEQRIALAGGLTKNRGYRRIISTAANTLLSDWTVLDIEPVPVDGALRLARRNRVE